MTLPKPKQTGKVFESNLYVTYCECGEAVTQRHYLQTKLGYDGHTINKDMIDADMFIGFCKCGNVFINMLPQPI